MEWLVRLCRALANSQRLAIARLLALAGEQRVSAIAEALGLPQPRASNELRILLANGVLWKRRSGTYVYYSIASSEVDRRQSIITLLASAFRHKRRGRKSLAAIARWTEAKGACPSDEEIFAFLTAFTHPRRLQIIRWLAERGPSRRLPIANGLAMSGNACDRHLDKLLRRGVIARDRATHEQAYRLAPSIESKFGASLLKDVLKLLTSAERDPGHLDVRDHSAVEATEGRAGRCD